MKSISNIFLCAISACLIANCTAINGLVAYFSLIPALFVVKNENHNSCAYYGAITGLLMAAILLYGISLYGWLLYILAILECGLTFALIFRIISYISKYIRDYGMIFIAPFVWVSFEYIRTFSPISLPLNLGVSQSGHPALIQIASIFGIYGVSFLVVLVNCALFLILGHPRHKRAYAIFLIIIACLTATAVWGKGRIENGYSNKTGSRPISIAALQGSIPFRVYEKEYTDPQYEKFISQRYLKLLKDASALKPNIIVGPENPVNKYFDDPAYVSQVTQAARTSGAYILWGIPEYRGEARYNSALLISPRGTTVGRYRKSKPVPFAEEYNSGGKQLLLDSGFGRLGILICFESTYPAMARFLTSAGANFLFVLTNDASFEDTAVAFFHARASIFRAVENARWLIRSAQNGISMVIDPYGRVVKKTTLFDRTIMTADIFAENKSTFYSRHGDTLPCLCLLITCILIFYKIRKNHIIR